MILVKFGKNPMRIEGFGHRGEDLDSIPIYRKLNFHSIFIRLRILIAQGDVSNYYLVKELVRVND